MKQPMGITYDSKIYLLRLYGPNSMKLSKEYSLTPRERTAKNIFEKKAIVQKILQKRCNFLREVNDIKVLQIYTLLFSTILEGLI